MQELERGDSGVRSFASVQGSLVMYPIHAFGSEEQKTKLPARRWRKGEIIGCFGLTEPDFGSNPGGMRTVAIDDGDSYVLNGTKRWITNGNLAQVALIWAKVGGVDGEVRGFLVPTDAQGLRGAPDSQEGEPPRERHERADSRRRAREEGRDPPGRARA